MSDKTKNKTNDTPKQILDKTIDGIQSAMDQLQKAGDSTTDGGISDRITSVYNGLYSSLKKLLHAQATTDDAVFTKATGALKQEAAAIKAEEDKLKKIADDVGKAAQVAGYIAQALTFIATLPKLP